MNRGGNILQDSSFQLRQKRDGQRVFSSGRSVDEKSLTVRRDVVDRRVRLIRVAVSPREVEKRLRKPYSRPKILPDFDAHHLAVSRRLDRTIERGMINYPFLSEHDRYLDNIRGDARFSRVMARARREWERLEV